MLKGFHHLLRADVWFSKGMLFGGNLRLFQTARAAGLRTSLDLNWDPLWGRAPQAEIRARKQAVKAPKLHLLDSGLTCHLLGIRDPDQLRHHPLRGPIFESWVASEIYKACVHHGQAPRLAHYRDAKRLEVDVVVELADTLALVEMKSAATVTTEMLRPLQMLAEILRTRHEHRPTDARLVHGGEAGGRRNGVHLVPWHEVQKLAWY